MTTALVPNCLKSILVSLFAAATVATPSYAQSPCDADLDHDGIVAGADLALVLGDWGPCKGCQGDVTNNGLVDGIDLAFVLTLWGGACSPVPWATVLEQLPDPSVVYDAGLRARILATGLPWRVRDNRSGIELVLVPPGAFEMGCSASSASGCTIGEFPVHSVLLTHAFYIGRYEVTQSQWESQMVTNPSYFRESNGFPNSSNRPVEQVSWSTIRSFLTFTELRLPTEAEWEYTCRAGTTTAFHGSPTFPNGMSDDTLVGEIAWHCENSCTQTMTVGVKAGNALGVQDMLGNVWEWCEDWFGPYPSAAQTNPTGVETGSIRVLRGGSWGNDAGFVRCSRRGGSPPDGASTAIGFRVARNP